MLFGHHGMYVLGGGNTLSAFDIQHVRCYDIAMANEVSGTDHNSNRQPITAEWGVAYPVFAETDLIDAALALYDGTGELHSADETAPIWACNRTFLLPDGTRIQLTLDLKSGEDMAAENLPDDLSLPWPDVTGEVMPNGDRAKALNSPRVVLYGGWWSPAQGTRPDVLPLAVIVSSQMTPPETFRPLFVDRYIDDSEGTPKGMNVGLLVWERDLPRRHTSLTTVAPIERAFRHTLTVQFLPLPEYPAQPAPHHQP
jgi:hypothetical protein